MTKEIQPSLSQEDKQKLNEAQAEHLVRVNHQHPEPPVRGETLLKSLDLLYLKLNHLIHKILPEPLNPFTQLGAIANTTFVLATLSGILLLIWYSTSVHTAYASVEAMKNYPLTAQLLRSLHRYSSDACMLFVLLHAFQIFIARRFGGARWLAWVSGILLLGLLWLDGWLGYWLVWDEKAKEIALATAKLLDTLPIFPEPLSMSFLTDETINSLLFFVVFFFHMLLPLGMGVLIWLHLSRLSRPHFLTKKPMTLAICISLLTLSLLLPAQSAPPAKMENLTQNIPLDLLYMFPLYLIQHLQEGTLWALSLLLTTLAITIPWWMIRRHPQKAHVLENRCNGCNLCYQDCPYNAIEMIPDPSKRYKQRAKINPEKCVGCGICVGACDPGAIIFPRLPVLDARKKINQWLEEILQNEKNPPYIAFLCASSAGSDFQINQEKGTCPQLPNFRVLAVPCSGWVHPLMIERAAKKGAKGVLVVGCGPDPAYRVGDLWMRMRLSGKREPSLRQEKIHNMKVAFVRYDRSAKHEFLQFAQEFQSNRLNTTHTAHKITYPKLALTTIFLFLIGLALYLLSNFPYKTPHKHPTELVVAFKHAGKLIHKHRKTQTNNPSPLSHMKSQYIQNRERVPVRMQIFIDHKLILEKSYRPKGIYQDGKSVALERLPLPEGNHHVQIKIGDTQNKSQWTYTWEKTLHFQKGKQKVILFNKKKGFYVH